LPIALAGCAQVVHRVQIDSQAIGNGRIEIARHRQIEDKDRPLEAIGLDLPIARQRHDRLRRAGRADYQVGGNQ
jgi:hypothetical protein